MGKKKYLLLLLGVVLGCWNLTTTIQAAQLVDLKRGEFLQNSDFEQETKDWHLAGQNVIWQKDTGGVNHFIQLGHTTDVNADGHVWQNVWLKPKTEYVLTAKVKVLSQDPTAYATLDVKSGGSYLAKLFKEKRIFATTDTWQNVRLDFTSDYNLLYAVGVGRWVANASLAQRQTIVEIDDISLQSKNDFIANNQKYQVMWQDDFNSKQLDQNKWDYELGNIRGVEQQHYVNSSENVFVKDGHLGLRLTKRALADQYQNPRGKRQVIYDSGSIRTHGKQEFLYGRIEMRAKLPKGQGVFPAFWTLGADFNLDGKINPEQAHLWPLCGEIDIMEMVGKSSDTSFRGNKTVWQTLHYGTALDKDNGWYANWGHPYSLSQGVFNDGYHTFGINWSKGKIEWYVDNQVVHTIDYHDDPTALMTLDRPQYLQLNLAAGGNWPGDAGANLAGQEFDVDYVLYAQNEQQQADAAQYYQNAPKIMGAKDVTMKQGEIPDLLANVSSDKDTQLDFSVDDEYQFQNSGGNTAVHLMCAGKAQKEKLATLPVGKYNLYYTALSKTNPQQPATRKTVILTVVK